MLRNTTTTVVVVDATHCCECWEQHSQSDARGTLVLDAAAGVPDKTVSRPSCTIATADFVTEPLDLLCDTASQS